MSPRFRQKMAGLTMIEILVALVVLSVGLLGMAALQLSGIRSANGSVYRTQATLLADDIAERMRANRSAVDANSFAAVNSSAINCGTTPTPYCGDYFDGTTLVAGQSCTSAQMAAYDINIWFCGELNSGARRGGVINTLAGASATIACTDIDPPSGPDSDSCTDRASYHTITLNWSELNPDRSAGAVATVNQTIAITVQP